MRQLVAIVSLLALFAAPAAAQDTSALINKALDEQVKLNLNTPLPQAMEAISRQTGVPLEAQPVVWELLPWGRETNITAQIENQTLREALGLMTRKLGLQFVVGEEAVQIQPMPPLRRLGRHATVEELAVLDLLASTPANAGVDRPTLARLIEAVDQKLASVKSPFAIENRSADAIPQDKPISLPRNATLMDALEAMARQTGATWYPWGKSLVVTTKEDLVRRQLTKPVSLRSRGDDVLQVLMELSARSGIAMDIQPGAIQQIPAESRNIRVLFENAPMQQVLEAIAGSTGLAYMIQGERLYVWNQAAGPTPGGRDRVVGLLQLDNGMQVLVHESQVTPEMQEYLRSKTTRQLEAVRRLMEEEGFTPTTRPAQPPVGDHDL